MPILEAEPDLFPLDLLTDRYAPEAKFEDGRIWWVSHTRPRQEKALARKLLESGVPYYLPCDRRRVRVRSRVVTSHVPLFSGYVFLRMMPEERNLVLGSNRVANLLPVSDQDRLLQDLRGVYRML